MRKAERDRIAVLESQYREYARLYCRMRKVLRPLVKFSRGDRVKIIGFSMCAQPHEHHFVKRAYSQLGLKGKITKIYLGYADAHVYYYVDCGIKQDPQTPETRWIFPADSLCRVR